MSASNLSRLLPAGSLAWGLQGVLLRSASLLVHHQPCAPSTSGRVQESQLKWSCCYATSHGTGAPKAASTQSSSTTSGASAAASATSAARPAAVSSQAGGDGASSAAFYVGLAARYPDPDTVPDHVMHRLRNTLFGRAVRPRETTGRRALARPLQGKALTDWYWMPPNESPGFHSEEDEYELRRALNRRHTKEAEAEAADTGADKKKKRK